MREAPIIQHYMEVAKAQGIKQGIEQGEKRSTIEIISTLLETRFAAENVQNLNSRELRIYKR